MPGAAGREEPGRRGPEGKPEELEKHFDIQVTDEEMVWARNEEKINAEARLDGICAPAWVPMQ